MNKIIIKGMAAVFDGDDNRIIDKNTLQKLDGIIYEDNFQTDYLEQNEIECRIQNKLERSGIMSFHYIDTDEYLEVRSTFVVKEDLNDKELQYLLEDTQNQWSDGMGESFVSISALKYGYAIMCLTGEDFDRDNKYPIVEITGND